MKNSTKKTQLKFLSMLCAVALVITALPAALSLNAKAVTPAQTVAVIDFDNTSMTTTNDLSNSSATKYTNFPINASTEAVNAWSVVSNGGNKALSFKYSNAMKTKNGGDWGVAFIRLNENGSLISLTPGELYTITFRYKRVGTATAGNTDWVVLTNNYSEFTAANNNAWGFFKPITAVNGADHGSAENKNSLIPETSGSIKYTNNSMGGKDICGNAYAIDVWNTISYTFTATSQAISIAGSLTTNTEIFFDDIKIVKNNDETVVALTDGSVATGAPGTAYNGSRPGTDFTGGQLVGGDGTTAAVTFPATSAVGAVPVYTPVYTTHYAVYDFNNSGEYDTKSQYYFASNGGGTSTTATVTDGALYLTGNNNQYGASTFVFNKSGESFNFVPGTEYTISFNYRQTKPGSGATPWIVVAEGGIKDYATYYWLSDAAVMSDNGGYSYPTGASVKNYRNYNNGANRHVTVTDLTASASEERNLTKTFIAYDVSDVRNNTLALTYCLCQSQQIAIDNVIIYETANYSALSFANADTAPIISANGGSVDLPVPAKTGYIFDGWYTDSKLTSKYIGTKYTISGNSVLYAKWREPSADATTLTIDDYPEAWTTDAAKTSASGFNFAYRANLIADPTSQSTGADDKLISVDNKAYTLTKSDSTTMDINPIYYTPGGNIQRQFFPLYTPGTANGFNAKTNDTVYKITFSYYVEKSGASKLGAVIHTSSYYNNAWGEAVGDGDVINLDIDNQQQWHTASMYMQMNNASSKYMYFAIVLYDTDGQEILTTVYVDDIILTPIETGTVVTSNTAATLTDAAVTANDGKQAIRSFASYTTNADGNLVIDSEEYTLVERGMLFRAYNAANTSAMCIDTSGIVRLKKTTDFNKNWAYDDETATTTFSNFFNGIGSSDKARNANLEMRAYLIARDSSGKTIVLYSTSGYACVNSLPTTQSK